VGGSRVIVQVVLPREISDPAQLIQDSVISIHQSAVRAFRYYSYATDEDEISDICQQITLLLIEDNFRRLRLFDRRKSSLQTWLKSVVRHHISNYIRRQRKTLSLDELPPESLSYPPAQEDLIILKERNEKLEAILSRLSTRDQQVIRLLYFEGLSAIDVARVMRINVDLVYWHKHIIIKKLKVSYQTGSLAA
jgi:RNA polymerase sigma-70 factor, ECF subfamily